MPVLYAQPHMSSSSVIAAKSESAGIQAAGAKLVACTTVHSKAKKARGLSSQLEKDQAHMQ